MAPPLGAVSPPLPPVPVLLVEAAGAFGAVVVVDVMVIVADPIVSSSCFVKEKGLRWPASVVGVMRGTQGSLASLCGPPGPLVLITASVYQNVASVSLSSLVVDSSTASSSGWLSSMASVVCTLAWMGPRNGL